MVMIRDFYQGKAVLLTGCTGFVGKVLLEKLLWSCPTVGKVFLLIRSKKGKEVSERFETEVLKSPCFDRLRARHSHFDQFVQEKVQVLPGDVQLDWLGLSQAHLALLTSTVEVVLNSAANVDFSQRLDAAIQSNVLGPMRLLEICKRSPNLKVLLHISTAYVNVDKEGWVEEKVHPRMRDPEELLEEIKGIPEREIEAKTPGYLGNFPNTYPFSKDLTEQLLVKRRGTVPLVIVRPTIVGAAWKEPYPGWVDGIVAAGAFYLATGLGILRVALGKNDNIGDQIPCDLVINTCLVAAALYAGTNDVQVIHSGSSHRNPLTWSVSDDPIRAYFYGDFPARNIDKSGFTLYSNKLIYESMRFAKRTVPGKLITLYAHLSRNPATIKLAALFQKVLAGERKLNKLFSYYTMREWIFASDQVGMLKKRLSKADRKEFQLDIAKVDWVTWSVNFMYGLRKWVLKETVEQPADPCVLEVNQHFKTTRYCADVRWAYGQELTMQVRTQSEIHSLILNSDRVQKAIDALASKAPSRASREAAIARTKEILKRMVSNFNPAALRAVEWVMKKVWRSCYDKVLVDVKDIRTLKKLATRREPIVFAPTSRSYMDFLLISFVLFMSGVNVPFIAAREDFLRISLVNRILRRSGAFFIKGKIAEDPLYEAILTEYIQLLLRDRHNIELFIEGNRSSTGKIHPPKLSLLQMCTEAYFTQQVPDVHIIPVVISYEKVMDGETSPMELLGEAKEQWSLGRLIKGLRLFQMNFGEIVLKFASSVSLSEFSRKNPAASQAELTQQLGTELVRTFQEKITIMSAALVASLLLMTRKGVTLDQLASNLHWIQSEIREKNCPLGLNASVESVKSLKTALQHLKATVTQTNDGVETVIAVKPDLQSILLLSYYRNTLIHVFLPSAYVACALLGLIKQSDCTDGVPINQLMEETCFFGLLLRAEFPSCGCVCSAEEATGPIKDLVDSGVLIRSEDKVKIAPAKSFHLAYLASLLWPFLDTYWITVVFSYELMVLPKGLPLEKLIQSVQILGESLYASRLIVCYESCSKAGIKGAVRTLRDRGVLEMRKVAGVKRVVLGKGAKLQELADHIGTFRQGTQVKAVHKEIPKVLFANYPRKPNL